MAESMIEPPSPDAKQDLENPTDIIHTVNFVTQGLTIAFCTFFCAIRAIQKLRVPHLHLVYDDYLTLVSYILLVGYCAGGISLGIHGGGYHGWEVPATSFTPFLKSMYATTIFYALMTLFIKLSILALIARIFAPYKRRVQGLYALAILLIVYYLTSLILKIRVCMPVSAYWEGDMDKCINQTAVFTADSLISTVTDAIILVLPLPLTWSLQISFQKKMRVGGMLAVGGLATAFSAWRLHLVINGGEQAQQDMTIFFLQVVLTGNAEAGIALICCCLPAAVGQFKFLRDRVGYGSSNNTGGHYNTDSSANMTNLTTRKAAARRKWEENTRTSLDEVELVANAQGGGTTQEREADHPGIMRKVEVTHAVSYYGSDASSENASKAERKSDEKV